MFPVCKSVTFLVAVASSLAPQEVYEVGSVSSGATFGLRLTAHNAAGTTTATVTANTGGSGESGGTGGLEEAPPNPLHADPRLLASAAASALALALTVAAAVLCLRRRSSAGPGSNRGSQDDQEAEENKTNLLQQRDAYYATVKKPQPVPATLERIPGTREKETEYSEDIYPYATFQLGEGRGGGGGGGGGGAPEDTATAKFQTFVYQDARYGPDHPAPTSTRGEGWGRGKGRRVPGGPRSESEEYDSLQSDTDTEHATSSRTESSIHLDSATLETHHALHLPLDPHLATLEAPPSRPEPSHASSRGSGACKASTNRNMHHTSLYHASRQAFEYTSASRGQIAHHSLPYPSPLLVQNKNRVQHQLVISRSTCHQNALQPVLQCRLALLRPGSLLLSKSDKDMERKTWEEEEDEKKRGSKI
ncbi:Down syndrome cell adhesion molecule-like protein Dscam2 [Portunus trituberculatus]|uniref:Down syndrome cell adhesion molecule-like protein Dscam2 n=1 Tax=Portunus trituberculatus TaxID=210409 RepID=A0A5B7F760_PORTR|nr:Down syndrome cell adhesion molecule-like protein Dscam2 [Portunus trituberculatus]